MSFRQRISITIRGFKILKQYCPGLVQGKAFLEFINSIQPFLSVWFSAQIINEISTQRRGGEIAVYVISIVFMNFFCGILKSILKRICEEKESQMWNWFGKIFSDKQMSLDFVDLENADIQRQKQAAEENLNMFGNGLAQLVWGTSILVRAFVNIMASIALTVTLFLSKSGSRMVDHPIWIFGVVGCIVLGGFIKFGATIKENEVFMGWSRGTVWFERTFSFYGRELYMDLEKAKDIRIYRQDRMAERAMDKLILHDRENRGDIFRMSIWPACADMILGLTNAICWLYVAGKAFYGAFGVGSIVQYVTALSRLVEGIRELMYTLSDNKVYCIHLQKLYKYLDIPNRMYMGTLTVEKREDNEYNVEFRNVSFRYPGTETWAIRNVNLKFKIGEKLAVVGTNGSGKTTFIKLLCRLYDPTEGEILLNGVNIKKYDYEEYMSLFAVVFQDFRLFAFELGQNVAASASYNMYKARECLEKAGFGRRLTTMPDGMKTCLYRDFDPHGVEISGGEAQKIALARALYRDAPFLVLDEPTAALDPVSEYEVYSQFNDNAGDKTAVYISHRLASCRFCDSIVVFHEGEVIQRGNHEQLLADRSGRYYELWNAQKQYYVV